MNVCPAKVKAPGCKGEGFRGIVEVPSKIYEPDSGTESGVPCTEISPPGVSVCEPMMKAEAAFAVMSEFPKVITTAGDVEDIWVIGDLTAE